MAGPDLTGYRLAPAAERDLQEIWLYSAETWSPNQADRYTDTLTETFERLVETPGMARLRPEFDPPVRIQPSGAHIVVYRIEDDHLAILRVLGGRQDWQAVLRGTDPDMG